MATKSCGDGVGFKFEVPAAANIDVAILGLMVLIDALRLPYAFPIRNDLKSDAAVIKTAAFI